MFTDRAVPGPHKVVQIPELEARGRERLRHFWQDLDEHLASRRFLVGDALSMADIDAFVVVDFAGWIKESIPEPCAHLRAWQQRIKDMLSV
jgi:glutathione S-transferase